ncbi:MAG: dTMP kinase [Pseudomonadota bacterium]
MPQKGLFLTLEGIDGSGKSTQIRQLSKALEDAGHPTLLTREPGGSEGAEEIRRLLVEGAPDRWSAETEILLFTAARRDHLERTIRPALARGDIVLCDRFIDSTRAYQGSGPLRETVEQLHTLMIAQDPDLTLVLDLDPEDAFRRAGDRGAQEDRFEQNGLAFQQSLRNAFHQIAASDPSRVKLIDAYGTPDQVTLRLVTAVQDKIDG